MLNTLGLSTTGTAPNHVPLPPKPNEAPRPPQRRPHSPRDLAYAKIARENAEAEVRERQHRVKAEREKNKQYEVEVRHAAQNEMVARQKARNAEREKELAEAKRNKKLLDRQIHDAKQQRQAKKAKLVELLDENVNYFHVSHSQGNLVKSLQSRADMVLQDGYFLVDCHYQEALKIYKQSYNVVSNVIQEQQRKELQQRRDMASLQDKILVKRAEIEQLQRRAELGAMAADALEKRCAAELQRHRGRRKAGQTLEKSTAIEELPSLEAKGSPRGYPFRRDDQSPRDRLRKDAAKNRATWEAQASAKRKADAAARHLDKLAPPSLTSLQLSSLEANAAGLRPTDGSPVQSPRKVGKRVYKQQA